MINEMTTIVDYYQHQDEDTRMLRNPLEYMRCKEIISRYLSKEKMSVIDIGGATGAFSFWLAELGHSVHLVDIVPKHINTATQRQHERNIKLASLLVCDARQLPYEDNTFDIALLMGPLYHIQNKEDRIQCIQEAYRVLKPNGVVLCEAISRYASMLDGFFADFIRDPEFIDIMFRDMDTGIHQDTSASQMYFTDAYLHRPGELHNEICEAGFQAEALVAVTSFGHIIPDIDNKIKDESYRNILLNTIRSVENDPEFMGVSSHFIGVGKKPAAI